MWLGRPSRPVLRRSPAVSSAWPGPGSSGRWLGPCRLCIFARNSRARSPRRAAQASRTKKRLQQADDDQTGCSHSLLLSEDHDQENCQRQNDIQAVHPDIAHLERLDMLAQVFHRPRQWAGDPRFSRTGSVLDDLTSLQRLDQAAIASRGFWTIGRKANRAGGRWLLSAGQNCWLRPTFGRIAVTTSPRITTDPPPGFEAAIKRQNHERDDQQAHQENGGQAGWTIWPGSIAPDNTHTPLATGQGA